MKSAVTAAIIEPANNLAGDKFAPLNPVTALSDGHPRALMIADTACFRFEEADVMRGAVCNALRNWS